MKRNKLTYTSVGSFKKGFTCFITKSPIATHKCSDLADTALQDHKL